MDAAALEQLRAALIHQDPTVRAVAARIAGVGRVPALLTDLRGALARELDERAAAELLRALLFFDDPGARDSAEGHLARAKAPAVLVYVEWLARTGPDNLAERMEIALRSLSPPDMRVLSPAMSTAILWHPSARERLFRIWLRVASGSSWRTVLDTADGEAPDADAGVLVEALRSDDPSIRQETVWAIVVWLARDRPVAAAALDAAVARPEGSSPSDVSPPATWEAFGRELIARRHRKEPTPDRSEFLKTQAPQHRTDARTLSLLKEITTTELRALREALGESDLPTRAESGPSELSGTARRGQPAMRTALLPWPNLLGDLLERSGCKVTGTPRFGAFEISYRPDGRPAGGTLDTAGVPRECQAALAALARMTLADPTELIVAGEKQWVIVPVDKDFIACVGGLTRSNGGAEAAAGKYEAPKVRREVRPTYPESIQRDKVQGTVHLEAIISKTGCIVSISVVRGLHPALDSAAVQALSRWRFSPARIGGEPVLVSIKAEMSFTLK